MASRGRKLLILLLLLSTFFGCQRREASSGPDPSRTTDEPVAAADKPAVTADPGAAPDADAAGGGPESSTPAPPVVEDASSAIVYPDGALRRIYPEDYHFGAVATVETTGAALETARGFLRSLVTGEVDRDTMLPESRFMLMDALSGEQWPGIDAFRLGEPISMSQTVVALPVALFSQGRRGTTEVYVEYDGELWYISEFLVFPGMFARDDGANQPTELFDPRSPQL